MGQKINEGQVQPPQYTWLYPTLRNGWVNYGEEFSVARFTKSRENVVYLEGLIRNGTIGSGTSAEAFDLPEGYRPSKVLILTVSTNGTTTGRIYIYPSGALRMNTGSNTWVSLDGVSFIAE